MFRNIIRNYISGLVFGIIILILSVIPISTGENTSFLSFSGADKIVHATMYAVFSALLTRAFIRTNGYEWRKLLLLLAAILAYSIIIELIQQYITSYRSGEILDVLANMGGILFGSSLVYAFLKIRD